MYKAQIINIGGQNKYDASQLSWVKNFISNLQNYYPDTALNSLELIVSDNVIALHADLFLYPISSSKLIVCFKAQESHAVHLSEQKKRMHKLAIANHANTKFDALSTFLILLIGLTVMPNGMGSVSSDLSDFMAALQQGKNAKLVNQDFFIEKNQKDIVSSLVWFNSKGKFSNNFYNLCAKVKNKLKSDDALAILNVTEHLTLKETTLAAVMSN